LNLYTSENYKMSPNESYFYELFINKNNKSIGVP